MINMFNIDQQVIDTTGNIGSVIFICECDDCKQRGFAEAEVKMVDGSTMWITEYDFKNNFSRFYKIGNNRYPQHINQLYLNKIISEKTIEIAKLTAELDRAKWLLYTW